MCWSGEASFTVATTGIIAAGYLKYRGSKWDRIIPPLYFCVMEALQGFGYQYVNMCELYPNKLIAVLSYLHICFQPFFLSMLMLSFVDNKERKKRLSKILYPINFIGTLILISNLFHFGSIPNCVVGEDPMCSWDVICTYKGDWHIAWRIPLQRIDTDAYYSYIIPVFFIPCLLGLWPFAAYHVVVGPYLASLLTSNINETSAIWCLFSEFLLVALYFEPLKTFIHKNSNNFKIKNNIISFIFVTFVFLLIRFINPGY